MTTNGQGLWGSTFLQHFVDDICGARIQCRHCIGKQLTSIVCELKLFASPPLGPLSRLFETKRAKNIQKTQSTPKMEKNRKTQPRTPRKCDIFIQIFGHHNHYCRIILQGWRCGVRALASQNVARASIPRSEPDALNNQNSTSVSRGDSRQYAWYLRGVPSCL